MAVSSTILGRSLRVALVIRPTKRREDIGAMVRELQHTIVAECGTVKQFGDLLAAQSEPLDMVVTNNTEPEAITEIDRMLRERGSPVALIILNASLEKLEACKHLRHLIAGWHIYPTNANELAAVMVSAWWRFEEYLESIRKIEEVQQAAKAEREAAEIITRAAAIYSHYHRLDSLLEGRKWLVNCARSRNMTIVKQAERAERFEREMWPRKGKKLKEKSDK